MATDHTNSIWAAVLLQKVLNEVCDSTLSNRIIYPDLFDEGAMVTFKLTGTIGLDIYFPYTELKGAKQPKHLVYEKVKEMLKKSRDDNKDQEVISWLRFN